MRCTIAGRGWTQPGGRPHAETEALAQAGRAARGATAYVSLEPCSHHGETPPCADALIAAGIARVVGAVVGLLAIDRIGRRRMLIGPFWMQTAVLLIVGLWTDAPPWVLVVGLALFALVNSYSDILTAVYPSEIFDTDIRSSGVGFGSAVSRIGAFLGTYLLPIGIGTIGVKWCMVIAAGLCVVGAVTGQTLAPETMNRPLTKTATGELSHA